MVTYPGDEVVGAPDARDLVLVEELGDGPLGAGVDLHEEDVGDVGEEEDERLPPEDDLVEEEDDEGEEGDGVEGAVAEEGPPREVQDRLGEEGAHADHEEDVEDGGADDRADAHVCSRAVGIIPFAVGWQWQHCWQPAVWGSGSWAWWPWARFAFFCDSYSYLVLLVLGVCCFDLS